MARTNLMPDTNPAPHSDAAHEEWFRAEVNQAIAEADRSNAEWVSQEKVKSLSLRKRAEWSRNTRAGEKASA